MGTAEAQRLTEEIVRQATASSGRESRASARSSYAEFRSASQVGRQNLAVGERGEALTFWKYLTARPNMLAEDGSEPGWSPARFLFEPTEQRVLSKATSAAGGFLVPQDFDSLITSARRARNVIGNAARQVVTSHGRVIPFPTTTAHGTGAWTSENAAVTASDDTFGQVSVGAFKAVTKTVVSEELVQDALEDEFDRYLGDELGQRLALLEEAAFAQGTVPGSRSGSCIPRTVLPRWPRRPARRPGSSWPTSAPSGRPSRRATR